MRAASSISQYPTGYGKLGSHNTKAWRPRQYTVDQWLEAQLSSNHYITSIETSGGPASGYYVKEFTVRFYNDSTGTWVSTYVRAGPGAPTLTIKRRGLKITFNYSCHNWFQSCASRFKFNNILTKERLFFVENNRY